MLKMVMMMRACPRRKSNPRSQQRGRQRLRQRWRPSLVKEAGRRMWRNTRSSILPFRLSQFLAWTNKAAILFCTVVPTWKVGCPIQFIYADLHVMWFPLAFLFLLVLVFSSLVCCLTHRLRRSTCLTGSTSWTQTVLELSCRTGLTNRRSCLTSSWPVAFALRKSHQRSLSRFTRIYLRIPKVQGFEDYHLNNLPDKNSIQINNLSK